MLHAMLLLLSLSFAMKPWTKKNLDGMQVAHLPLHVIIVNEVKKETPKIRRRDASYALHSI